MKKNIATNRNRNYYIKLACLLLFSVPFSTLNTSAFASSHADKEMLTILLQDKTLKEVFSYIEKHSSYIFIYEEAVNLEKKGQRKLLGQTRGRNHKRSFLRKRTLLHYKRKTDYHKNENEHQPSVPATAQTTLTVRGNVKDHTGTPLAGVNVILKGTTRRNHNRHRR